MNWKDVAAHGLWNRTGDESVRAFWIYLIIKSFDIVANYSWHGSELVNDGLKHFSMSCVELNRPNCLNFPVTITNIVPKLNHNNNWKWFSVWQMADKSPCLHFETRKIHCAANPCAMCNMQLAIAKHSGIEKKKYMEKGDWMKYINMKTMEETILWRK